jgi:hypothetical protein
LVQLCLRKSNNTKANPLTNRIEKVIGDEECLDSLFSALVASYLFLNKSDLGVQIDLTPDSYDWLSSKNMVLAGESCGLAAYLMLTQPKNLIKTYSIINASGAIRLKDNNFTVGKVGNITKKLNYFENFYQDSSPKQCFVCPRSNKSQFAKNKYSAFDLWLIDPSFKLIQFKEL